MADFPSYHQLINDPAIRALQGRYAHLSRAARLVLLGRLEARAVAAIRKRAQRLGFGTSSMPILRRWAAWAIRVGLLEPGQP